MTSSKLWRCHLSLTTLLAHDRRAEPLHFKLLNTEIVGKSRRFAIWMRVGCSVNRPRGLLRAADLIVVSGEVVQSGRPRVGTWTSARAHPSLGNQDQRSTMRSRRGGGPGPPTYDAFIRSPKTTLPMGLHSKPAGPRAPERGT